MTYKLTKTKQKLLFKACFQTFTIKVQNVNLQQMQDKKCDRHGQSIKKTLIAEQDKRRTYKD